VKSGRFTKAQIAKWSLAEAVFHLDADEKEREAIEGNWRHRLTSGYGDEDVPKWFARACGKPTTVATLRRRRA
jgi:hypothetical protein